MTPLCNKLGQVRNSISQKDLNLDITDFNMMHARGTKI